MLVCNRCGSQVGLLASLSFNKQPGRCGRCEKETQQALQRFRQAFLSASQSRLIAESDWQALLRQARDDRLNQAEALTYILGDSLHFLERTLTFFFADQAIAPDEEQNIRTLLHLLAVPEQHSLPLLHRLDRLKALTRIRRGVLPTVATSIHLESGEICHMESDATFNKVNARSVSAVPGRFVATNKKLHFLSSAGGAEIHLKRIMRVERNLGGVYLELSTKKGNGLYHVPDPEWVEAIVDTLTRMAKRQLVGPQDDSASRHIPQEVKQAVWQHDQGKCVQCAASNYLEFDHIIPFSKGGASTVNNVQLLCRKCNLA